jgi:hypothetical protein
LLLGTVGTLVTRQSFEVFGEPSDALGTMLANVGAIFMDAVGGF